MPFTRHIDCEREDGWRDAVERGTQMEANMTGSLKTGEGVGVIIELNRSLFIPNVYSSPSGSHVLMKKQTDTKTR